MELKDMILTDEDTAIAGKLGAVAFTAWLWEVREGRDYAKIRLDMKRSEFGWLPAARVASDLSPLTSLSKVVPFCDDGHL